MCLVTRYTKSGYVIVDTHAHLGLCKAAPETLILSAQEAGVSHIINVGLDISSAKAALALSKDFPQTYPTVGIYPGEPFNESLLSEVYDLAKTGQFCAIGEIGLDFHWMKKEASYQRKAFIAQLELARELDMPVIIHNRETESEMIEIMKAYTDVKKVFHCFGSGMDFAEAVMDGNTYFSFTGTVTYAKKGKTVRSVRELPLNRIMVETDCPYLTPKVVKGSPNQPAFVSHTLQKLVDLRVESEVEIQQALYQTSCSFFGLS